MSVPAISATGAKPKILIFATTHWISTARLAMTLATLGCEVDLTAPKNHPALSTDNIISHHTYWPMRPLAGLRRALRKSRPDLLLLADELSFLLVEQLVHWAKVAGTGEAEAILALLRRSFGNVENLPLSRSRMDLLSAAERAGVSIPHTVALRSKKDLKVAEAAGSGPWMLKADATWGGFGVRKVSDPTRLFATWKRLQRPLNLPQSLKRGWSGKEWGHLHLWLQGSKRDVIAQGFVQGKERTGLVVCSQGQIWAAVCFEVEETCYPNGPASVVRVIDDHDMIDSMQRTVKALGISGFCGFDFMLDAETGKPLLLEMNTRPTQLAHLPLGTGRDLCAALVREVLGRTEITDRANAATASLVALFPQAIQRNSPHARSAETFHDVPWAAPRLMQLAVIPSKLPATLLADPKWQGGLQDIPVFSGP
ncbi:MAG: ATP-grasp domain-containing protein [Janthinobacterium lividum]